MSKLIVGAGGGKSGGGGSEANDTLFSSSRAFILDAVSEGPIEGLVDGDASIYLNDIPVVNRLTGIRNYKVDWAERKGGVDNDTPIRGFSRVEALVTNYADAGTPLETNRPRSIAIHSGSANAIKFSFTIPMLANTDTSGNTNGSLVSFRARLVNANGDIEDLALGAAPITINSVNTNTTPANTVLASVVVSNNIPSVTHKVYYRLNGSPTWVLASSKTTVRTPHSVVFNGVQYQQGYTYDYITNHILSLPAGSYNLKVENELTQNIPFIAECRISSYNVTISGKTTVPYTKDYEWPIDPINGPYQLIVTKTSTRQSSRDMEALYLTSVSLCTDSDLIYPGTALMAIKIDSKDFSSIPTRGYLMKLLKVKIPSNYNPVTRVYTGAWDGTFKPNREWTDNPAWCYYDLITNTRYGLGDYISSAFIDTPSLYAIAKYCDELVPDGRQTPNYTTLEGLEPRFTCNTYIQNREDAYTLLNNLASIFRGLTYWDSTRGITLVQDAPTLTTNLFNNTNVIDGMFNYTGSASQARHTVALVSWNDPEDNYRQKVEYVEDTNAILLYGVNQTEVLAYGCTSRGQAHRYGRHLLYTEAYETEVVAFKSGLEGSQVYPGDVIEITDRYRIGARHAGRLVASHTVDNLLTNSEDLTSWTPTEATLSSIPSITAPSNGIGTSSVWELKDNITNTSHWAYSNTVSVSANTSYYISALVKTAINPYSRIWIRGFTTEGGDQAVVFPYSPNNIDILSSTSTSLNSVALSDVSFTPINSGWFLVRMKVTPTINTTLRIDLGLYIGDTIYAGSTLSSIYISSPSISTSADYVYLATTSTPVSAYALLTDRVIDSSININSTSLVNFIDSTGEFSSHSITGYTSSGILLIAIPTFYPILNSIWSISVPVMPTKWRVLSVAEDSVGIYSINGIQYSEGKYDHIDLNTSLEPILTSLLTNPTIAAVDPNSIKTRIEDRTLGNNTWQHVLVIEWNNTQQGATSYDVVFNKNNQGEVRSPSTPVAYFEIANIKRRDEITFSITVNGVFGAKSAVVSKTIVVDASLSVPGDVPNFRGTNLGDNIQLSWDPVTNDPDLSHYEIRFHTSQVSPLWGSGTVLVEKVPNNITSVTLPNSTGSYMIKAKDFRGLVSIKASYFISTFKVPGTPIASVVEDSIAPTVWPSLSYANTYVDGAFLRLSSVPSTWYWQSNTIQETMTVDASGVTYDTLTGRISFAGTVMPTGFDIQNPNSLSKYTTVILSGFTGANLGFNGTIVLDAASTPTTLSGVYTTIPIGGYTDVITPQDLLVSYGIPMANVGIIGGGVLNAKYMGWYDLTGSGGTSPNPYELAGGVVGTIRLIPNITAYAITASNITIDKWLNLLDVINLTGANPDAAGAFLEYSTATTAVPISTDWSVWKPLIVAADATCRWIKFRLVLYTSRTDVTAEVAQAEIDII